MPTGDTDFLISILNTNCTVNLTHLTLCVGNQGCWDETKLEEAGTEGRATQTL